ncbi:MAG TPA: beta-L-arabinofuranosidase domain-containing protein [Pedobacter sp.]|uniref:beta-L-arabinofuranosidase domain-containing protein n=1 Tax=Pedobacter sp. TaxID=1411316 RepID=UPI002C6639E6|nr:beta-L-arabinofuranosidase domain-containing protein [Pedobacter sp.]HMI02886.1 beta-L-arabinofuranosidase domain-containing protein [Pedobacter sp.]
MNRKTTIAALAFLLLAFKPDNNKKTAARNPGFVKPKYTEVALGAIKPAGWLRDQLQTMLAGTTGHLDEVYPKVKNDNGWLGGKGDSWEETPYWLDGAVPLAWQLDNAVLKQKVLKYINWVLEHQRPSGYFGAITNAEREGKQVDVQHPENGDDWWPKMVMLKVMQQYYSASGDKRVISFMEKYFDYQKSALQKAGIGKWTEWAISRGHDNAMMAQWLYTLNGDQSLLELAELIQKQSFPWSELLSNRDWVIGAATQQNDAHWMNRHGVNVGMALKTPAIDYQRTGDVSYLKGLKTGFRDLMTLHGLPMGVFSADEDLHGNLPTQGVELCATVEAMYSLEKIIQITGDTEYMDALERMTFNALPPQTTDDFNNKQYFQIANQVQISRGVFDFSLPFDRQMNNVLGMRSGYTCCLANMHQGWTKYTQSLWFKTAHNGLAALVYAPNVLKTKIGEQEIIINENTNYPFEDEITFEFSTKKAVGFPLELRIPVWCKEARISINGVEVQTAKGGTIVSLSQNWKNKDKVTLKLPMQLTTSNWGRNSRAIERGPLVYALKLEERWEKGNQKEEGDYFSVFPKSDWNYGLLEKIVKDPAQHLQVKMKPLQARFVWNLQNAPIEITASGKKIPAWKAVDGVARQPVTDRTGIYKGEVDAGAETFTLVPFGFTKVRIVAFPVVK